MTLAEGASYSKLAYRSASGEVSIYLSVDKIWLLKKKRAMSTSLSHHHARVLLVSYFTRKDNYIKTWGCAAYEDHS